MVATRSGGTVDGVQACGELARTIVQSSGTIAETLQQAAALTPPAIRQSWAGAE